VGDEKLNRLKKAAERLRCYLGKDNTGIEMLKNVVEIANEMRKEIAALGPKIVKAHSDVAAIREQLNEALAESKRLAVELVSESSRLKASEYRARLAEEKSKKEPDEPDDEWRGGDGNWRHINGILSDVRKQRRVLPKELFTLKIDAVIRAQTWKLQGPFSMDDIMFLGRLAICCSHIYQPILFYCHDNQGDERQRGTTVPEEVAEKWINWIRNNIERDCLSARGYLPKG